ncbi:FMN-binding protein [Lutispora saccharofermentans]|mgnify:CR=1 FL=1|uniref:FMN-binding domain-containing protein n=1 Tax=Lutispora saccharofermentans TaxID=3024236 RepID=A0ABT1NC18_9FIRM|nr:hypothetical protein [Lutispora saccharofermentans]MCQ1528803.1 hypothetical protein [Lutispora saccharofermentans]
MGGIFIKHKIILLTRKRVMIYALIIVVLILAIIALTHLMRNREEPAASSNSFIYLQYKDGKYIGNEKTDKGNIQVEVTIKKNKIKDIEILEFPQEYLSARKELKDETAKVIEKIIKTQEITSIEGMEESSYIVNKLLKAVRIALDQSLLQ